jgi:hypothetical protein
MQAGLQVQCLVVELFRVGGNGGRAQDGDGRVDVRQSLPIAVLTGEGLGQDEMCRTQASLLLGDLAGEQRE